MPTNSRYQGEVRIDPPLNWAAIKKASQLPLLMHGYEVKLVIKDDEKETDEGVVSVKTCSSIIPMTEKPYAGYKVQDALQQIIDAFPDRTFSGYFEATLEDASWMCRYVISGRKVEQIFPDIHWPMP